ncbi:MAG TPA: hypothetical protein VFX59_13500 [Polyangiales bacterium]|nr:hypothetical protein [Polyangiales bacterium]
MRTLLVALTLSACTLDARDLDAFRETARGPEKLSALVHDPSRPSALRAEAALRLLDLERPELDGRALLLDGLKSLDEGERAALVPTLEHGLTERMETPADAAPAPRAVRAKDVAVRLLPMFPPAQRAALGANVVRWIGVDVERRADVGEFSLEQVTAQVGAASAGPSADSLRTDLQLKSLSRLTDNVLRYGDRETRAKAAAKLVEVERAYRGQPDKRASLESYALPALGQLVDTEAARQRLVAIACDPRLELGERERAFDLLQGHVSATDVPVLAQTALDDSAAFSLRTRALARLGDTQSPDALKPLLALVGARNRTLREPAFSYALTVGGERAVTDLLAALPQHWNVSYAKDEIDGYSEQLGKLPPTSYLVTTLGRKTYAYFWWQRVLGIRYIARNAPVVEAKWRLKLHENDTKEIAGDGWPGGWTIAREVAAGLAQVDKR